MSARFFRVKFPIFKAGEDFASEMGQAVRNAPSALDSLAQRFEGSAQICRQLAVLIREHPEVVIQGIDSWIIVDGPDDVLGPMVASDFLYEPEEIVEPDVVVN